VLLQRDALSPWQRDYLMTVGAPDQRPSRTLDPADGSIITDPARDSTDASVRGLLPDLIVDGIGRAMAELAGLPLERSEGLVILRYGVGQQYRLHGDYFTEGALASPRIAAQGQRVTTVIAYLNQVAIGGATHFPALDVRCPVTPGGLLCFDNLKSDGSPEPLSRHCGEPVMSGQKWIVTAWFRERPPVAYFSGQIPRRA